MKSEALSAYGRCHPYLPAFHAIRLVVASPARLGLALMLAICLSRAQAEIVIADFEGNPPQILFSPLDLNGWTIVSGSRNQLGIRKGALEFCDALRNHAVGWNGSASRAAGFPDAARPGFYLQFDVAPGVLGITGLAPASGALTNPQRGPEFGLVSSFNGTGYFFVHQSSSTNFSGGGQLRLVIDPAGWNGQGAGYLFVRQIPNAILCGVTFGGNGQNDFSPIPDLQNVPLGLNSAGVSPPSSWSVIYFQVADLGLVDNIVTGHTRIVRLRALEVTQSIQSWANTVPLIQGKSTYTRVFLEAADPADVNTPVTGRLRGFRNGVELPRSPLSPTTDSPFQNPATLPADAASARSDSSLAAASSLNFILPPQWLTGTIELRFEPDDALLSTIEPAEPGGEAGDGIVLAQFQPSGIPRIVVRPVKVKRPSGNVSPGPRPLDMVRIMESVRGMYPVSRLNVRWGPAIQVPGSITGVSADRITRSMFNAWRRISNPGNHALIGLVNSSDMLPTEETKGQRVRGTDAAWVLTDYSSTSGHELGHVLGLSHAVKESFGRVVEDGIDYLQGQCQERTESPASDFENFFLVRDPEGSGPGLVLRPTLGPLDGGENAKIFGLEYQHNFFFTKSPSNVFELMSYCGADRWVSDRTYNRLRSSINARWAVGVAPQFVPRAAPLPTSPANYLLIGGTIQRGNGSVEWSPFQCLNAATPPPAPASGDYSLKVLNGTGAVLAQVPFGAPLPDDFEQSARPPRAPFLIAVPYDSTARRVELRRGGTLMGARDASAHPPEVQVISPNGGETISNTEFEIRWQGVDADGDELSYTVEYSPDNGVTWDTLALDLPFTNIVVRCDEVSGGAQALVRVLASDGFHCVCDDSNGTFTIPDKGPDTFISSPEDGAIFHGQEPIVFRALALDMEEGQLEGNSLEWSSDQAGLLGTGDELFITAWELPEGSHRITLTARDNAGHITSVTNTITVSRFLPSRLRIARTQTNDVTALEVFGNKPSHSVLEVSSNLVTWLPWRTVVQSNWLEIVLDIIEPGQPKRFYRVRSEPLPTTVLKQPSSVAGLAGGTVAVAMKATGQWLSYQWFFEGVLLTNATSSTLVLADAQPAQSGNYFVVVSNLTGVLTSATAVVTILSSVMEQVHQFGTNSLDGINGWGPLTLGSDGWIYGCARNGAISNAGVAFKLRPGGRDYTVLHRFELADDGGVPLGGLLEGSDGKLYGTTSMGGTNNAGTVFTLNRDGSDFTVLHHFLSTGDCRNPQAELIEGSDGALYGTAYNGGGIGRGGIFKINKDGLGYTIITGFNFGGSEAPRGPLGGLVELLDGMLYGTTELGGGSNKGAIFKIGKDGSNPSVLKSLGLVEGGAANPSCTLLAASDGFLYGTTYSGGASNLGTVFKMSTNASFFSVIAGFGTNFVSGLEPRVGLTEAPNGQLAGVTRIGGASNAGALFRLNRNGSGYETLRSFNFSGTPGARPRSPLLKGPGGVFYGMTFGGGSSDQGVIFRYFLPELGME